MQKLEEELQATQHKLAQKSAEGVKLTADIAAAKSQADRAAQVSAYNCTEVHACSFGAEMVCWA